MIRGLLTVVLGTPIAFAAPIQEAWQPQTPSSVYEYATTHFDLSETQANKLLLYEKFLLQGLSVENYLDFAPVIRCESNYRHYKNGEVLVSPTSDRGLGQINPVNFPEATTLGYDINTPEGNAGYTAWKFAQEGVEPWVCAYKYGKR